MSDNVAVSIVCITYNQEPYIRKVLDSFVNQKTNFKIQIIIHDDASTDGTKEILEEYKSRYNDLFDLVLQEENKYSQGIDILGTYVFPLVKGKYIAYCEGDDYWPDLNMLQKQYDFLEAHPEYSACAGVTRYFNDDNEEVHNPLPSQKYAGKDANEYDYLNIPEANIATNTVMQRFSIVDDKYLKAKRESSRVGDILIMVKLFEAGKVYVFNDVFQIHRIQSRANASNYNKVFNWKERFEDVVKVIRAIENNYDKKHDLHTWYESYAYNFFIDAVKSNDTKAFMQIQSSLPDEYKRSLIGNYITYGLRYLKSKIKI